MTIDVTEDDECRNTMQIDQDEMSDTADDINPLQTEDSNHDRDSMEEVTLNQHETMQEFMEEISVAMYVPISIHVVDTAITTT